MEKKYLIIAQHRTGSTATHLALSGHKNVSALHGDVHLENMLLKGLEKFTYYKIKGQEKENSPEKTFDYMCKFNQDKNALALGMKTVVFDDNTFEQSIEILKDKLPDVYIIACIRDDTLAQFASFKKAVETNYWHSNWKKPNKANQITIKIDPVEYSHHYIKYNKFNKIIRSLSNTHNYLEISYENDLCKGTEFIKKMYDFLNLSYIEPTWFKSKKISKPVQEYVTNYEQIRELETMLKKTNTPLDYTVLEKIFNKIKLKLKFNI